MLHLVCLPAFTVLYSSQKHPHQLPPKEGETSAKGIDVHTCITDHFTCFRTKKLELQIYTLASHTAVGNLNTELRTTPANITCYMGQQALNIGWGGGEKSRHHLHRAKTQTNVTDENRA